MSPLAQRGPATRTLPRVPTIDDQQDSFTYHVGECSRSEANKRLHMCRDGTFLVRKSTTDGNHVFSVIWRDNPSKLGTFTHAKIIQSMKDSSMYALADVDAFPTIEDLVAFYQRSPIIFAMRFWPEAEGLQIPPFHPYDKHHPDINSKRESVRSRASSKAAEEQTAAKTAAANVHSNSNSSSSNSSSSSDAHTHPRGSPQQAVSASTPVSKAPSPAPNSIGYPDHPARHILPRGNRPRLGSEPCDPSNSRGEQKKHRQRGNKSSDGSKGDHVDSERTSPAMDLQPPNMDL